jgi:hypothetical protein
VYLVDEEENNNETNRIHDYGGHGTGGIGAGAGRN